MTFFERFRTIHLLGLLVALALIVVAALVLRPDEAELAVEDVVEPESTEVSADSAEFDGWQADELAQLRTLWIGSLRDLPPNPSNQYADNLEAAELGHKLFFETRLSANGEVSCASCHIPNTFTDDTPVAEAGLALTDRRTMTIVGTAYSPWQFWDGRKDSQWSQALGPWESAVEHGGDRLMLVRVVAEYYREEYEAIFGALPNLDDFPAHATPNSADEAVVRAWNGLSAEDQFAISQAYANMGKAVEAYERQIRPNPSRFDDYVEAILADDEALAATIFTADEVAGFDLFIGQAQCIRCHNGPLLTNNEFHNTGVPQVQTDVGRSEGVVKVLADEFNCLGEFSDADPSDCAELRFVKAEGDELVGAFRAPSLRNISRRAPYMHAGQLTTLADVINHYNNAPSSSIGASELNQLQLSGQQMAQLYAFLQTLADYPPDEASLLWHKTPELPSEQN